MWSSIGQSHAPPQGRPERRLLQEVRGLQKAHKVGVNVPSLYYVEVAAGCLYLERVQGGALKDALFGQALSEAGEPSSLPAQAAPPGPAVAGCHAR